MNFSIIIPTYGDLTHLSKCVSSLKQFEKGNNYEVIIVDDGSNAVYQRQLVDFGRNHNLRTILKHKNTGFAAAVNEGIREAKNEIIVLCNNDIVFIQPILNALEQTFVSKPVGIVGAYLKYPDGRVQHAGMGFNHTLKTFVHTNNAPNQDRYVIAVTGALFSFRKHLVNTIGFFNEKYFLACEDTDYCLRAWKEDYGVYYTSKVKAVHLEGATRGKDLPTKRTKKPDWHQMELRGITQFRDSLDLKTIEVIERKISILNNISITPIPSKPIKLEIGSGFNPHPGYEHLDIRRGLPHLEYVCDFSKEKLPFANNSVEEILANHVIEHISFRKLPFVLKEWERVLIPGGKLTLRTPNLEFIIDHYKHGLTTPEWPEDEKFIRDNFGEITSSWWANLKLFSGQDYDSNFHHICFDFGMLVGVLCRYGFEAVKREKFDKEFSPGELQVTAKKIAPKKTALIIRKGAIGDVLLTTPITRRLKESGYDVDIYTFCNEVYENNPDIHGLLNVRGYSKSYDKVFDLDLCYERSPKMHIIDAYSMAVFGDTKTPHDLVFNVPKRKTALPDGYFVIHMSRSWENRTWPKDKWIDLVEKIHKPIVCVGSRDDFKFDNSWDGAVTDLVGKLRLEETAAIIKDSRFFIGTDSSLLHIAQALKVPSIGIYTCAKAEYRSTGALAVIPDIDCYGCLHDEKPPVTYCGCRRGDFKCLDLITPEMVLEKVNELLGKRDNVHRAQA